MFFERVSTKTPSLGWKNVSKYYNGLNGRFQVLQSVDGLCLGGEMLGFMGLSGSGKTTLLQLITGRECSNSSGVVYCNNTHVDLATLYGRDHLKRSISFLPQWDILLSHLTVVEHLYFTALLHSKTGQTEFVNENVQHLLKELNMTSCANTQMWHLSGGERKRCSIMTELLGDYRIMILDEPLSGLDSAVAQTLLKNLKALTRRGHGKEVAMIMSLHQPSSFIFYTFDKVVFLSEGRVVYFGAPTACSKYLSRIGYKLQSCDGVESYNPADYMIELLFSTEQQGVDLELQCTGDAETMNGENSRYSSYTVTRFAPQYVGWWPRYILADLYNNSDVLLDLKSISHHALHSTYHKQPSVVTYRQTFLFELWVLLQRGWKCANRSPSISRYNIFEVSFIGTLAGLTWFQINSSHETDITKLSGFLFFCCCYWLFAGLYSGLLSFLPEKVVVRKERAVCLYRLSSYYLAKAVGSLPVRTVLPIVFGFVSTLFALSSWSFWKTSSLILVLILCALTGESVGVCIGALVDDLDWSISIANIFALTTCIFGGFYIRKLPALIAPLRFFSVLRYSFDAVVQVQLPTDHAVICNGQGHVMFPCYAQKGITGLDARKWLEVEQFALLQNVTALVLCYLGCRGLGFAALRWREFYN